MLGELNLNYNQINDGKKWYSFTSEKTTHCGEIEIIFMIRNLVDKERNSSLEGILFSSKEVSHDKQRLDLKDRFQKALQSNRRTGLT